jgi:lactate dehydrogenase-like 2-hydroxyacid dehydrogenase
MLNHTKHLEKFAQRKVDKKWEIEPIELVSNKHMAIIGNGDFGSSCAKIAKLRFGMNVTDLKEVPIACLTCVNHIVMK